MVRRVRQDLLLRLLRRIDPLSGLRLACAASALVLALGLGGGGCTRKTEPTTEPLPELAETQPAGGTGLVEPNIPVLDLVARAESLQATSRRMPGRSADEHRRLMHDAFGDLSQILPHLVGPEPAGRYRQQLRAVENARARLGDESAGFAPEPTVDAGLRAAYGALSSLQRDDYAGEEQLAKSLEELRARLDYLDTVRGAMHRAVAGESVELTSDVVRQMVAVLAERMGEPGPATAPAAAETAAPEGAPAAP